jgi:murein tripeptide amidase MpaA
LVIAGTHGDENSSIVTLSCALRTLTPSLRRHHVILAVNPDGCQLGLRANARGVDLNRNFPAANWCADLSLPCITAEFPPISSDEASEKYLNAMMELLRWQPQR